MQNKSYEDWVRIHNRAARDYINGEWSREVLLGVGKRRKELFARATGNVLDVGCGYGINFPYLVHATRITGIDFSSVMLEKARETARTTRAPIRLYQQDAEHLEFPDNSFDTVISALATCSFFRPVAALQEMQRVCKPEGRILLLEHGRSSWNWLGNYQDRHVHEQIEQGCRWNQEPLELVKEAGLQILRADRAFLGILHAIILSPARD